MKEKITLYKHYFKDNHTNEIFEIVSSFISPSQALDADPRSYFSKLFLSPNTRFEHLSPEVYEVVYD